MKSKRREISRLRRTCSRGGGEGGKGGTKRCSERKRGIGAGKGEECGGGAGRSAEERGGVGDGGEREILSKILCKIGEISRFDIFAKTYKIYNKGLYYIKVGEEYSCSGCLGC